MEFSGETALKFERPFRRENITRATEELKIPIRDLAKKAEQFAQSKPILAPTRFLNKFIFNNRERISSTLNLIRRQSVRDKELAKQVVAHTLVDQLRTPANVAEVVSKNLVEAVLTKNKKTADNLLEQTLDATTLKDQDKRDLVNLTQRTDRELVPVSPVIEAEHREVEEKPEEVEYTPPGGPPGGPPERPRRRRFGGFGRGRRRDRTAREAFVRRGRLPFFLVGVGAVILGLSVITGEGRPHEGWPADWAKATVETSGSLVEKGFGRGAEEAIGLRSEKEFQQDRALGLFQERRSGFTYTPENAIRFMVNIGNNMDTIRDWHTWDEQSKGLMSEIEKEAKKKNIKPEDLSKELERLGYDQKSSEILGKLFVVHTTKGQLSPQDLSEIKEFTTKNLGIVWR